MRRNRDAEILDAAIDLFQRKGYAATTIQDIAAAVGILKVSVYHYVASKEDLLFRICERSHEEAAGIIDAADRAGGSRLDRLRRFVELYVRYYLDNIERVQVYQRERRFLQGERWEAVVDQRRIYERYVEELVGRDAAFFIFGAINGIPEWYSRDGRLTADEIPRLFAAMACASAAHTETDPTP